MSRINLPYRLLLVFFIYAETLQAQPQRMFSYTAAHGLPNDNVTCIKQDREGFLWVGTYNGLCRFDGTHFYTFPSGLYNSNSLMGDLILDLEEDGDYMWVAHRFGVSRINKYSFNCENFQSPDMGRRYTIDRAIRDIYTDKQGTVWFAGDRQLLRFNQSPVGIEVACDLEKMRPPGASSQISKIINGKGDFILLYLVNGWVKYDSKHNYLDSQLLTTIPIELMKGENLRLRSYWNTFASGYYVGYDTKKRELKVSISQQAGFVSQVRNIYVDSGLTLYINSERKQTAIWTNENRLILNNGLATDSENNSVAEFNYGYSISGLQYWARPQGLFIADKSATYSAKYFFSGKAGERFNREYEILDVKETGTNDWLITANGGLFVMNRATHHVKLFPQWEDSVVYTAEVMPDGTFWLSTNQFLYQFHPSNGKILHRIFIESYAMALRYYRNQLVAATRSNGLMIIGTADNDVVIFRAKDSIKRISFDRITALKKIDDAGNFFITYNSPGLFSMNNFSNDLYRADSIPFTASVFNEKFAITAVQPAPQQLWLGQYIGGLMLFDSLSGKWTNFTRQVGLGSNYISEILCDSRRRVWIVTSEGVDIYDPAEKNIFKFPQSLRSGGRTGGFMSRSGTLVFFDREKIIETNPDLFSINSGKRKILLAQVVQEKNQLDIKDNLLRLPYKRNSLSIVFSLQKLDPAAATRYSYRLRNTADWTDIGKETNLSFVRLQPGNYKLQIRATDEFGQWRHYSDTLTIVIKPPFWKTWWFYILTGFTIGGLLWMIYRYRIGQLKKILAMRAKISQDLHDEVGATLSGVTLMSELANEKLKANKSEESKMLMERITGESKDMAEKMNDIVWAINPMNDSMEKVLNKIFNYGNNLCGSKNIKFHFSKQDIKDETLNMQMRSNIYLISKEAINNAVKYSGAANISFELSGRKKSYLLKIKDDGKGFDTTTDYSGNGLQNMKARATEIDGRLQIESDINKGTEVILLF
jgi:signal transduction histidine kinase/ligand-binding sensor domain-containing protein